MKLKAFNLRRAEKYGYKPNAIQRAIYAVSRPHVHVEDQFGYRYDYRSYSATTAEDADAARFINNTYTHPEYWDDVNILMSIGEEDLAYAEAKRLEGTPYDTIGVIGQATDWNILKPDPNKTWCSKVCARVICAARPDFGKELVRLEYTDAYNINPADLFMLAMNWFK